MFNALSKAQKLAEKVRFAGDTLRCCDIEALSHSKIIKNLAYATDLNISKDITPSLFESLNAVYERLNIPRKAVEAFVYSSPEIQAECYAGDKTECIIRFSSGMIDLLNKKEFEFIAGHEIGHFILKHGLARAKEKQQSLEFFMQQRAQEISVDRIGLLACGSLDMSIKALMKLVSGLTGKHLRFNVGTFLSQLRKSTNTSLNMHHASTHPPILIRCRALLWFSLNDYFVNNLQNISTKQLINIDKQIQNDLDKHVDGPAKKHIREAKENLAMWMAAHDIVQDGIFSKKEQTEFSKRFGTDTLGRLLSFLKDIPASEVKAVVSKRLKAARKDLEYI